MRTPHDSGGGPAAPDSLPAALVAYTDYEVLRRLGGGGMGVVYLARNRLMKRLEALKLSTAHGPDAGFLREVQATARLAHPNIVAVYSARVVIDTLVLAMEYIDGCDLWRLVARRGRLPVASACELIRQAAVGLQHAHDAGLVHRDLKPSNLILRGAPGPAVLKILDFGLARAAGAHEDEYRIGTPAFAAPEQYAKSPGGNARSDVYALGGTLYYLLTGSPPFATGRLPELVRLHREQPAPRLDAVRPEVPGDLARLVERMLAKSPADRPATAGEVAGALATFVVHGAPTWELAVPTPAEAEPVSSLPSTLHRPMATPPGPTVPFVIDPPARGKRVWVGVAGVAVLAAGAYLGCVAFAPREGTPRAGVTGGGPDGSTGPAVVTTSPVPLFDGATLAGWVVDGGDADEWQVKEGVITTTGLPKGVRSWLLSEREYEDFRVRFEYRLAVGANSGFAFRAVPGERPVLTPNGRAWPIPFHQQVEISDTRTARWAKLPTGQVNGGVKVDSHALRPTKKPPSEGEWAQMEIEFRGQAVRVRVNGTEVLDDDLDQLLRAGSRFPALSRKRGRIGFQQSEGKADFRNITIEEFPPAGR
ncbi:MAG: family 16 glycoside hydrolase [Gemmataceae bacterium]